MIDNLPTAEKQAPRELDIAKQLIDSMSANWNPDGYHDSYRERVEDLIDRKQRGEEIVTEGAPAEEAEVTDLMDALRRSAEQMRGSRPASGGRTSGKGGRTRRQDGKRSGSQSRRKAS